MLYSAPMLASLWVRYFPRKNLRSSPLVFQTLQVFITRIGGLGLALLSNLALTRWLGISAYGQYVYIIAWMTILSIPSVGMGTLVLRETAIARRREDEVAFGGLMRWSSFNTLWMSVVLALFGVLAVSIQTTRAQAELRLAYILGLSGIPLIYFQNLIAAVFRGCRRVELAVFVGDILSPSLICAWAGGCLLIGIKGSASMALGGRLAALGIVLLSFALLLPRMNFRGRWSCSGREQISAWRKSLYSLALLKGITVMAGRLPLLMLGYAIGPEAAALFSLSSRVAETVSFTLLTVVMTTGPLLAEFHAKRDYRAMQQLLTRSTTAISLWAVPLALGLIIAGRWLLGLFGPHFSTAYPLLVVLVIGQTINSITGTVGLVMNMGGLERVVLKAHAVGLATTAVLCLALIPIWGSLGAAIGSAMALILWNIILAVQLYRRLGISSAFYAPGFFRGRNTATNPATFDNPEDTS
jgi:O-antigen/teichoic acid export membrane protein